MPLALAFSGSSSPLTFPDLPPLQGGVGLQLWIRRASDDPYQVLLQIGASDGSQISLETGPNPATLILSHTRGGARQEIVAAGGLPLGRFVLLTATLGSDGRARIQVCGALAAEGNLGAPSAAARTGCALAPFSPRGRLSAAVASLKIYCPQTSTYSKDGSLTLQAGDLFGDYPLDGTVLHHHEVVRGREIAYYAARDVSGKGHTALVVGEPPLHREDGPLLDDKIPALQITEAFKSIFYLSGISGMGGELTLEAWINPQPGNNKGYSLFGLDGGSAGVLTLCGSSSGLQLVIDRPPPDVEVRPLGTSEVPIPAGRFTHVAVTLRRSGDDFVVTFYHNGQRRAQRTIVSATWKGQARVLRILLAKKAFSIVNMTGPSRGQFVGAMSEVRVWSKALGDEELAARWLVRAAGDEPNLRACYRLDEQIAGCVTDISAGRGFGLLNPGASITTVAGLPLPSPLRTTGPRVVARGKLVREGVPIKRVLASRTGRTVIIEEQQLRLFDVTLRPTASGGQALLGAPLEVRVDQALTAVVSSQGSTELVPWSPGQTYVVPVPASGALRLRFLATELSCPAVRVRLQGMNEGQWLPVRPDGPVLGGLRGVSKDGLQRPADGRPSPLPAGASDADAEALAQAVAAVARVLPPQPRAGAQSRGLLGDIGDGATSAYKWVSRQASEAGQSLSGVVALSEDAARGVSKLPRTAAQLVVRAGDALTDLYKKARSVAAHQGAEAIGTFISSADTLAVIASAGVDEIDNVIEIVGSTLVNGASAYWRVIVSGVKDALAAIKALAERIGAEIQKILDYLAYLFRWDDFLKASDDAMAFSEDALRGLQRYLQGAAAYKAKVSEALSAAVPQSVAGKSMAQLFGVDIDGDAKGVDEINYVVELIEEVFRYGELVLTTATSGGAALTTAALQGEAKVTRQRLPLDTLRDPVRLLSTPIGTLLAGGSSAASSSGNLVDALFAPLERSLEEGVRGINDFLRKRIDVPWLTDFIEKYILKGRELTFLRLTCLIAAISKVLAQKLGGGSTGGARSNVVGVNRSSAQPQARSSSGESGWDLWVQMSFGLLGSTLTAIQTGLELASGGQRSAGMEKLLSSLTLGVGCCVGVRALIMALLTSMHGTGEIKTYATVSYALEVVAGFWLVVSGKSRLQGQGGSAQDIMDVAVFGLLTLALLGLSITPVAKGLVVGTQALVSFGLRAASWVLNSGLRVLSAADNEDSKYKKATLVLVAVCGGVDLGEAIYDHANDIRSGT